MTYMYLNSYNRVNFKIRYSLIVSGAIEPIIENALIREFPNVFRIKLTKQIQIT